MKGRAYARNKAGRICEARQSVCARQGRGYFRGIVERVREARKIGCERQGRADALDNPGGCAR
jgi:hypothetical protein